MINYDFVVTRAIAEEAAEWLLRLDEPAAVVQEVERREFVAWLRRSPQHIEEFLQVSALRAAFSAPEARSFPAVQALINEARLNVVDIVNTDNTLQSPALKMRRVRIRRMIGGAAGMVLLAAAAGYFAIDPATWGGDTAADQTFTTDVGELRSVVLDDGSVVNMNTRSALKVRFTQDSRLVELTTGEAIFDVHKDVNRPFRVKSGSTVVEAIGTRFNVYRQDEQTVITVVEGQVAVFARDTAKIKPIKAIMIRGKPPSPVRLETGRQVAVLQTGDIGAPKYVDAKKATAWTERQLVFDAEPLQTVARELNRYNHRRLRIGDARVAKRNISGVFNANEPETLLAFLETVGDIRVEPDPTTGGWILHIAENKARH